MFQPFKKELVCARSSRYFGCLAWEPFAEMTGCCHSRHDMTATISKCPVHLCHHYLPEHHVHGRPGAASWGLTPRIHQPEVFHLEAACPVDRGPFLSLGGCKHHSLAYLRSPDQPQGQRWYPFRLPSIYKGGLCTSVFVEL